MDSSPPRYAFRDFLLEPAERRLSRDGVAVDLPSKIFDVLTLLVRRAGHLVSKDEFHAVLWPRQVVSEATLNKYVWQLRRTLGDGDGDGKLIETVPRQGYRFVAAVQNPDPAGAPDADVTGVIDTSGARAGRKRIWLVAGIGLASVVMLATMLMLWTQRREALSAPVAASVSAPPIASGHPRRTLAVASADLADGLQPWLGVAVAELLARELAVSGQLRIVPRDAASFDVPTLAHGNRASRPDDLSRWRTLGADVLVVPRVQRSAADGIELHLRLLDSASGQSFAEVSASGSDAHLDRLIGSAGERVRAALSLSPLSDSLARTRNTTLPRDSETARLYAQAIGFLRDHMEQLALDRLAAVTQREPDFIVAWLELARAELDQGYAARAAQSARDGLAHAAAAPREVRLSLEAVQFEADGAWTRAVESHEALVRFFPDQPEYALRLMSAQVSADDKPAAEQTLQHLRDLPGLADDARTLLAEYQLARAGDDWTRAHAVATRMLARGEATQSDALRARALSLRGMASTALRDNASAAADLLEARGSFVESKDRNWLARTELLLGNVRMLGGDLVAAERHYHAAVDGYRALGARWNENVALDNLLAIAIARGDPVAARGPVEELLASTRALGNTLGEARALIYLAWVELDAGHSDAALGAYREAVALNARAGNRAQHVAALAYLSDLLATTGDTAAARETAQRALDISESLDDMRYRTVAHKAVANAARARQDIAAARAAYARARSLAAEIKDPMAMARIDLARADLDLDAREAQSALDLLATAEPVLADSTRDLVTLNAMRARALTMLGQVASAQSALATSRTFADQTTGYLDRLPFRMAEVDVVVAHGDDGHARELATALRDELRPRRFARELAQLDAAMATGNR